MFKDIVNKSTIEILQTKCLQEFPRRLVLNDVTVNNMKDIYNSQTKMKKKKLRRILCIIMKAQQRDLLLRNFARSLEKLMI